MGKKDPFCQWCQKRKSIVGHASVECPNRKCNLCKEKGHLRQVDIDKLRTFDILAAVFATIPHIFFWLFTLCQE